MSVRSLSWLWILGALVGAVGIWYATRAPVTVANAAEPAKAVAHTDTQIVAAPAAIPTTPAADSATVKGWIVDATAGDAARRAAALRSLARAPRAQALPVLKRVLMDGEPAMDRPLALQSLRELALEQGDGDGAIRDALRGAIYHGDDNMPAETLQETLDVIEESEMRPSI